MKKKFILINEEMLVSSAWMEDAPTRLVWITMLLMMDKNGLVESSPSGLAHRARVTIEECNSALEKFKSPDREAETAWQEGRRICSAPGGWLVINHQRYQFPTEAKRAFWAEEKRKKREQLAKKPLPTGAIPETLSQ